MKRLPPRRPSFLDTRTRRRPRMANFLAGATGAALVGVAAMVLTTVIGSSPAAAPAPVPSSTPTAVAAVSATPEPVASIAPATPAPTPAATPVAVAAAPKRAPAKKAPPSRAKAHAKSR